MHIPTTTHRSFNFLTENLANNAPTTITDADLSKMVFTLLEPHGFSQYENRLVKANGETMLLITLQKPCCSSVHNLNLAVVVNQLVADGVAQTPTWGHLQTRLCLLAENDLPLALDSMEPMAAVSRREIISEALSKQGLPWLNKLGNLAGIRAAIKTGEVNPKHHPLGSEDYSVLL